MYIVDKKMHHTCRYRKTVEVDEFFKAKSPLLSSQEPASGSSCLSCHTDKVHCPTVQVLECELLLDSSVDI